MSLLPIKPDQTPVRSSSIPGIGDLFRLTGAVGPEAANARDDVIRAQILLGESGDLDLDSLGGPTGWPGGELTRGLKRYQRRKGLTVDGLMLPDGETITALQDELYDRLARYRTPTTAEVDRFHDRLARYRADGSEDVEPPRMELVRSDSNRLEALPRAEVRSDADVDASPDFTPGAQVAQLAEGMMMQAQAGAANSAAAAGAAGIAGATQQRPPGVTPEQAAAGRQLEKWVGNKVNLLSLPWQMYHALSNGTASAPPSELLDPATEAASKTPPLKPSAPAEPKKYSGDLLAEGTRALESGIRDIFGTTVERHETENTRLSSNIIVEQCNEVIGEDIRLHGFEHIAGASKDGREFPEKALKDGEFEGGGGHSFPDILYQRGSELVGINSATESAPGHYIGREVSGFAKLVKNMGQWVAGITGKKRPDEDIEDYRKRARAACEETFAKLLEKRNPKLDQASENPEPASP